MLLHRVAEGGSAGTRGGIGVIDATAHPRRGDKTPGAQRQYCGESGKIDNCVVAQHLLWTDNDSGNPACHLPASDLYLPAGWAADGPRRREAGVPPEVTYQPT